MANEDRVLYLNVDNVYGADEMGLPYRDLIHEGVVDWNGGDFDVSERAAGANMSVDVAAGACWIKGDDDPDLQPTYRYREPAITNVAVTAADVTNPRKDIVIAEVLDDTFSGVSKLGRIRVVAGTPAGSPVEPSVPNNALKLAVLDVPALDTTIADAQITDTRKPAHLGRPQTFTTAEFAVLSNAADSTWDGLEIELEVDATAGVYWRFRYRAASASAYKWEAVPGNVPLFEDVLPQQSTTSSTYTDLTTVGPDVTIPRDGDYDVEIGGRLACGADNQSAMMSFETQGVAAADADNVNAYSASTFHSSAGSGWAGNVSKKRRKTGLLAGTVRAKYRAFGTGFFSDRWISVTPVRIG